ncbi:MAG: hypothetical protein K8R46_06660 [Pirellulales bacterium]|nr:hypothetical protein [Pirellulales bacterium]
MAEIERQWHAVWEDYDNTPDSKKADKYGLKNEHLIEKLSDVLKQNVSDQDIHRLADMCEELPVLGKDRSEFVNRVLEYMARHFLRNHDRDGLLKLLTTRFPDQFGPSMDDPIEYHLVDWGEKKDGILLLGEAYAKCKDPQARHHLAIVVRRAFIGSGIKGKDDDEFVKNAMQWYEKEKDHLIVNIRYRPGVSYDMFPGIFDDDRKSEAWRLYGQSVWPLFKKRPLFVEKSSMPGEKEVR